MGNPRNLFILTAIICVIYIVKTHIQGGGQDGTYWIAFSGFFISFLSWQFTGKKKDEKLK